MQESLAIRVWEVLRKGPATVTEITEALDAKRDSVHKAVRRMANATRIEGTGGPGKAITWFLPDPTKVPHFRKRRCLVEKVECAVCETAKRLVVHHIDGDHSNCDLENQEVLCRSCHSRLHWARRMYPKIISLVRFPESAGHRTLDSAPYKGAHVRPMLSNQDTSKVKVGHVRGYQLTMDRVALEGRDARRDDRHCVSRRTIRTIAGPGNRNRVRA